jgi:hypothetical protein
VIAAAAVAATLFGALSANARTVFTPDTKYNIDSTGWQHGRERINQPSAPMTPAAKRKGRQSHQPQR